MARAVDAAFGRPLVTNVHRSMLVEAMIAEVIEPEWAWCSSDYASCDFRHYSGARLEVKQSAILQTWNARTRKVSKPRFEIAPRKGEYVDGVTWVDKTGRNADLYLFAFHHVSDTTADHRDPEQWSFYIALETALPKQDSIALSRLAKWIDPVAYDRLASTVESVLSEFHRQSET